ncbi:hypothetical protein KIPB_002780 [Kipferlia bialata]|uniref:Uncharacterized protein n=1 Tax=Kipferlia bialata TaxID=797122 RepID=A0A391NUL0_9EUKA|nr:hypothetical protein KIPB_002780 [Kipferlia bialata]|eukprot:g2780.t1
MMRGGPSGSGGQRARQDPPLVIPTLAGEGLPTLSPLHLDMPMSLGVGPGMVPKPEPPFPGMGLVQSFEMLPTLGVKRERERDDTPMESASFPSDYDCCANHCLTSYPIHKRGQLMRSIEAMEAEVEYSLHSALVAVGSYSVLRLYYPDGISASLY